MNYHKVMTYSCTSYGIKLKAKVLFIDSDRLSIEESIFTYLVRWFRNDNQRHQVMVLDWKLA